RLQPDHHVGAQPLVLPPPEDAVQDIPGVVVVPPQPWVEVDLGVEAPGDHQGMVEFLASFADLHRNPLLVSSVIPIIRFPYEPLAQSRLLYHEMNYFQRHASFGHKLLGRGEDFQAVSWRRRDRLLLRSRRRPSFASRLRRILPATSRLSSVRP